MPLYEYYCPSCDHQIELIQKVTDVFDETCENCGKSEMKKKLSLTSFQLKGGGWYKDGYTNQKKKEAPPKNAAKSDISKKPPVAKTSATASSKK